MTALVDLPTHAVHVEEPLPSELVPEESGHKCFRWMLTASERAHIAEMLNTK